MDLKSKQKACFPRWWCSSYRFMNHFIINTWKKRCDDLKLASSSRGPAIRLIRLRVHFVSITNDVVGIFNSLSFKFIAANCCAANENYRKIFLLLLTLIGKNWTAQNVFNEMWKTGTVKWTANLCSDNSCLNGVEGALDINVLPFESREFTTCSVLETTATIYSLALF